MLLWTMYNFNSTTERLYKVDIRILRYKFRPPLWTKKNGTNNHQSNQVPLVTASPDFLPDTQIENYWKKFSIYF